MINPFEKTNPYIIGLPRGIYLGIYMGIYRKSFTEKIEHKQSLFSYRQNNTNGDETMKPEHKHFLIMRSEGASFDKIAKELKISKQTAIQWAKLYANELQDLKFQSLADVKQEFNFTVKAKYQKLLEHLAKIDTAISELDLSNASIKDLYQVRAALLADIERIESRQITLTGLKAQNLLGEVEDVTMSLKEVD